MRTFSVTNILHTNLIRYEPFPLRTIAVTNLIPYEPYPIRTFAYEPLLTNLFPYEPCVYEPRSWKPEQEPENVTSRTGKADGTDPSLGVEGVVDGPVDAGRQRSGRAMQTMTPDDSDSRDSLTLVGPPLPPTDSPQSDPGVGPPRGAGTGSDPDVTPRDPGVDPGVQTPLSAGDDPDGRTPRDTGVDPNLATSPSTSPDPGVGAPLGGGDPGVMTPPNVNTEPEGAAAVTGGTAAGPRRSTRVRRYPDYFTFSLVLLLWVLARLSL